MMFEPGKIWLDSDGQPIQAHGAACCCIRAFITGMAKTKMRKLPTGAMMSSRELLSSTDLYTWKNKGVVLPSVPGDVQHDLHPSKLSTRPKVLWNAGTGKFVLWAHIDSADYKYGRAGVRLRFAHWAV
jgi:hypothetical protein